MKLKVFTKGEGPVEREVLALAKEVEDDNYTVEYFELESDDSYQSAEIYNIYQSPALVVTQDDGKFVEMWQGSAPTRSELINFMRS